MTGAQIRGATITSVKSGEIVRIVDGLPQGQQYGFGNHVIVYIGKDSAGNRLHIIYGHMQAVNRTLQVGQLVTTSTALGWVGTSGFSTGPHLHLELQVIRPDGTHTAADPLNYGFNPNWFG